MAVFIVLFAIIHVCSAASHDLCGNGGRPCSSDVPCADVPGGRCAGGSTCCPTGCCPLPNAVCCSDGEHCCPHLTVCDTERQMCIGNEGQSHVMLKKDKRQFSGAFSNPTAVQPPVSASFSTKDLLQEIPCPGVPGGTCPDATTCCTDGCCPFPDGVCCPGIFNCCPSGMKCDTYGFCTTPSGRVFSFSEQQRFPIGYSNVLKSGVIQEALPVKVKIVYCPGGQFYCQDGNTCCRMPDGSWGCCPLPYATCCPDKIHCCPSGYRCDSTSQHCIYGSFTESSRKKFAAFSLTKK